VHSQGEKQATCTGRRFAVQQTCGFAMQQTSGQDDRSLHCRSFRSRRFRRSFLGMKMLAKFLRLCASDIGTHRRLALCGCLVTIATHMLAETVYRFLGNPAPVAEANGVLLPLPHDEFRSAEYFALGQNARMGMTVILSPRQAYDLHCIVSSEASLTFSLPRC